MASTEGDDTMAGLGSELELEWRPELELVLRLELELELVLDLELELELKPELELELCGFVQAGWVLTRASSCL
jgi:hypothetical protein